MSLFSSGFWLQKLVLSLGPLGSYPTNPLELFAAVTALWCVFLTVRQNIWCWPIGIVSSVAYGLFFREIRLYADAWLQVFFVGTSIYGWVWWLRGGPNHSRAPVSNLDGLQRLIWGLVTVAAVLSVGAYHARYTNAALPYWDALASGGSVTAQLLMMRKKAECWPLWLVIDVLSVAIYVRTQIFFTAALYVLFLFLAALGWHQWTQELRKTARQDGPSEA